jgi:hypothetical protein
MVFLALGLAVAVALLASDDGAVPEALPLVATALLCAVFVPLARAFVAPTWPETLGAFHAPPGADISAVWDAEGRAAGLAAIVPAWSVLRALPLAGCVVLAYASLRLARPLQATTIVPSRSRNATGINDSPLHGPVVQYPSPTRKRAP